MPRAGQTLVWHRPPWVEPDAPRHFGVLFEDEYLLAVNKPGGLPTLPGGKVLLGFAIGYGLIRSEFGGRVVGLGVNQRGCGEERKGNQRPETGVQTCHEYHVPFHYRTKLAGLQMVCRAN